MPQLDTSAWPPQLFWLAITFAALYFVIVRIAIPGVGGAIEARQKRIAGDLAAAQALKGETDAAVKAYEAALAEARAKAAAIQAEARAVTDAEIEAQRRVLDAEIAAKVGAADKSIAAAKKQAMAGIKDVAAELAADIVGQLTGARVIKAQLAAAVRKAAR